MISNYTPINKYKLSKEGRKIFDEIEEYIKEHGMKIKSKRHTVTKKQYALLLDGVAAVYRNDESLQYGDFSIVRINK